MNLSRTKLLLSLVGINQPLLVDLVVEVILLANNVVKVYMVILVHPVWVAKVERSMLPVLYVREMLVAIFQKCLGKITLLKEDNF